MGSISVAEYLIILFFMSVIYPGQISAIHPYNIQIFANQDFSSPILKERIVSTPDSMMPGLHWQRLMTPCSSRLTLAARFCREFNSSVLISQAQFRECDPEALRFFRSRFDRRLFHA